MCYTACTIKKYIQYWRTENQEPWQTDRFRGWMTLPLGTDVCSISREQIAVLRGCPRRTEERHERRRPGIVRLRYYIQGYSRQVVNSPAYFAVLSRLVCIRLLVPHIHETRDHISNASRWYRLGLLLLTTLKEFEASKLTLNFQS